MVEGLEKKVAELYKSGLSFSEITIETGVSYEEARKIVKKFGIPIRHTKQHETRYKKKQILSKADRILSKLNLNKFKSKRQLAIYLAKRLNVSVWFVFNNINLPENIQFKTVDKDEFTSFVKHHLNRGLSPSEIKHLWCSKTGFKPSTFWRNFRKYIKEVR